MDYGHRESDKMLKALERKLEAEYRKASKQAERQLRDYLADFEKKAERKLAQVAEGTLTEKEYQDWAFGQIMTGKRWSDMRDTLAQDYVNADKIAAGMVKEHTQDVYALNHNYGTFEMEKGALADTSYTLYNRETVERLMKDDPTMLPAPGKKTQKLIAEGKAVRWNNQQIQSVMTQSILLGESIPKIASRLAEAVGDRDRNAAVRNARTMTTGAENAGRMDSYKRAEKMGIKAKKVWLAVLDSRTRDSHRELDAVSVDIDKKFPNGLEYPGDPSGAAEEVYNCRCAMVADVDKYSTDWTNMELRNDRKLGGMSYEEWKRGKKESKGDEQ